MAEVNKAFPRRNAEDFDGALFPNHADAVKDHRDVSFDERELRFARATICYVALEAAGGAPHAQLAIFHFWRVERRFLKNVRVIKRAIDFLPPPLFVLGLRFARVHVVADRVDVVT